MGFLILGFFGSAVGAMQLNTFFKMKKYQKSFKLQKKNDYSQKIVKINNYDSDSVSNLEIENIINNEKEQCIINFITILKDKIPSRNLTNFFSNLDNFVVSSNVLKQLVNAIVGVGGSVQPKNKKKLLILNLGLGKKDRIIFHELLHFASTVYDEINKKYLTGFHHNDIGRGINEGYTELLTKRFFFENSDFECYLTYDICKTMSGSIEKVIGKETMQDLYFSADLGGLINNLSMYIGDDKSIELIKRMDFVVDFTNFIIQRKIIKTFKPNEIEFEKAKKQWIQNIFEIAKILLQLKIEQLKTVYDDEQISSEEFKQNILEFWLSLIHDINQKLESYFPNDLLDENYCTEFINSYMCNEINVHK